MIPLFVLVLFAFALGLWAGWQSKASSLHDPLQPAAAPEPRVVVNVPANYKPLEPLMLDGKPALVGPRALLWWTVYDRAIKAFSMGGFSLSDDEELAAYETARNAVQQIYGNTHDT